MPFWFCRALCFFKRPRFPRSQGHFGRPQFQDWGVPFRSPVPPQQHTSRRSKKNERNSVSLSGRSLIFLVAGASDWGASSGGFVDESNAVLRRRIRGTLAFLGCRGCSSRCGLVRRVCSSSGSGGGVAIGRLNAGRWWRAHGGGPLPVVLACKFLPVGRVVLPELLVVNLSIHRQTAVACARRVASLRVGGASRGHRTLRRDASARGGGIRVNGPAVGCHGHVWGVLLVHHGVRVGVARITPHGRSVPGAVAAVGCPVAGVEAGAVSPRRSVTASNAAPRSDARAGRQGRVPGPTCGHDGLGDVFERALLSLVGACDCDGPGRR
mmetsp:Transcript_10288/g.23806  ORF Transcript_10288/g.23806 Transcript_10288/m.23806 type:complete len:324 (-) Transcript_10288:732-1703(-)